MKIYGVEVDTSKGFDCFRGQQTQEHFATYAQAKAYAKKYPKTVIRYYAKQAEKK